ncbi:Sialic acid TRAP transporter permease protein SiaT [Desulfuromonas sp. DDH964]|uniref:TRAP transporter small permease n=1 Tax=Desulfuromonas sp. DDH964 TaxID=1823759 RepID=UPI00078DBA20|nr:TRAP transporter small permease [Desulfuromonas sp. DDH964]AMV72924.1 Sialic acid TRAP transporter permease protein SiaT [Desulfuromonas sp. DDH964]
MNRPLPKFLVKLDHCGRRLEDAFLVLLFCALLVLAALQIVQRNLFAAGFVWSDELLRILVLWVGLFGAVAASRDDNHINIDIFSRWLSGRLGLATRVLVDFFTTGLCGLLAWHGGRFVAGEREYATTLLDGIPAWLFEAAIPLAFGLIAWRYGVFLIRDLLRLIAGEVAE